MCYNISEMKKEKKIWKRILTHLDLQDWIIKIYQTVFYDERISEDESRIVVKVADEHIVKTKFGWALILDQKHVVFLKIGKLVKLFW